MVRFMNRLDGQPESARNGPPASGSGGLTPKQEAVALALAAGRTIGEAALDTGAGERTIKTWLGSLPDLHRRVTDLRAEMTARALGRLTEGMTEAADTLRALLRAKSRNVRLGAARAILELGTKLRESVELEQRITALEAGQGGAG